MKIKSYEINNLVLKNDALIGILIYGSDYGLISERSKNLIDQYIKKNKNSTSLIDIDNNDLSSNNSLLKDNANQISLLSNTIIIRIKSASDNTTESLKDYFSKPNKNCLIIIETLNLRPSSSLRKLFESNNNLGIIACYQDDDKTIIETINKISNELNLNLNTEVKAYLLSKLGLDTGITKQELNKLSLYTKNKQISLKDAMTCIGDQGLHNMDKFCDSIAISSISEIFLKLDRLIENGANINTLIRSILIHFQKLLTIKNSEDINKALKGIKPPIYFKRLEKIKKQLFLFEVENIYEILKIINKLDLMCKKNYILSEVLLRQALLKINSKFKN